MKHRQSFPSPFLVAKISYWGLATGMKWQRNSPFSGRDSPDTRDTVWHLAEQNHPTGVYVCTSGLSPQPNTWINSFYIVFINSRGCQREGSRSCTCRCFCALPGRAVRSERAPGLCLPGIRTAPALPFPPAGPASPEHHLGRTPGCEPPSAPLTRQVLLRRSFQRQQAGFTKTCRCASRSFPQGVYSRDFREIQQLGFSFD